MERSARHRPHTLAQGQKLVDFYAAEFFDRAGRPVNLNRGTCGQTQSKVQTWVVCGQIAALT